MTDKAAAAAAAGRSLERTVAVETSLLLATLTVDYGMEHKAAVAAVERALAKAYWGTLPEGYSASIVEVD